MNRSYSVLSLTLAAVLAAACSSGPELRVARDPGTDLAAYRTFGYGPSSERDPTPLFTQQLQRTTSEMLARHGYRHSETDPDLRVHFIAAVADRVELRSTGATGPRGRWLGTTGVESVPYREGTLAIVLVDTRRNKVVWRGVAEGRLSAAQQRDPGALTAAAVNEIFRAFPAGPTP